MTTIAIILAAGRGTRAMSQAHFVPKQYRLWGGVPILRYSLETFLTHRHITAVRVVIHPDDKAFYQQAKEGLDTKKLLRPIVGGETRHASALLGLRSLQRHKPDIVAMHDGARPFCSPDLISACLAHTRRHDGAIAALPLSDTLHYAKNTRLTGTMARQALWQAQTPQLFRYNKLMRAYKALGETPSPLPADDADVAHRAGLKVRFVTGEPANRKLTFAQDFMAISWPPKAPPITRIGLGFDSHEICAGHSIKLAGVTLPAPFSIKAHSDGDVILHALCDALYGALGDGDIGTHFSPKALRNADRDSQEFLAHAIGRMHKQGFGLVSLDIVVLAEAPKLSPYRSKLRHKLSKLLGALDAPIAPQAIGFKAKTFEGLTTSDHGQTMRGIAAQVIVGLSARHRVA